MTGPHRGMTSIVIIIRLFQTIDPYNNYGISTYFNLYTTTVISNTIKYTKHIKIIDTDILCLPKHINATVYATCGHSAIC